MYKLIMTLGVVAAVGFALGCGGGEDEATSASLTKAQFMKQANEICAKSKKEREAEIAAWEKARGTAGQGEPDIAKEVLASSLRREAEELEALKPPAGASQLIGRLARASEILAKKGGEAISSSGVEQFEAEAAAYGLKSCSPL